MSVDNIVTTLFIAYCYDKLVGKRNGKIVIESANRYNHFLINNGARRGSPVSLFSMRLLIRRNSGEF